MIRICVTCYKAVSDECIVCCWCEQWEHRTCANNIKQSEFVMLESPSKNIFFFCSFCVINLPKALSLFNNQSQLDGKLEAKFQSMESTVTKLTQQYISTEHSALQKAVSDLFSKTDNLQTQESKVSK